MSNAKTTARQKAIDELQAVEELLDGAARRLARLRATVEKAPAAPLQRGGQQHRPPERSREPGDEMPVTWPCRRPDGDGYAVKLQDRAGGAPGMTVRVETKGGKSGEAELDEHLKTDQYGEIWTAGPVRWDD